MMFYTYGAISKLENHDACPFCLEPIHTEGLICFTDLWIVSLHPRQSYIGSCLVYPRRHVHKLTDLSDDETIGFKRVMVTLEKALVESFGAQLLNYSCWMNFAFRKNKPIPPLNLN